MRRVAGVLLLLALVGAACGDDDADTSAEVADTSAEVVEEPVVEEPVVEEPVVEEPAVEEPAVEEPAVEEPAVEEPAVEEPAVEEPAVAADLAAVCPNPLVMQDNWFPAAEQGYVYRLIGDAGELDAENGIFRGPLLDTGIDLEIRSGGPYLGFQATTATMQLDPNIHLGIVDTDEQVAAYDVAPTVAVFTPLNISPLVLMWNPEEYSFASFEEIGQSDATVLFFPGTFFVEYMVQAGILREDQLDPSYDGSPARFVTANGRLAQQAFLTTAAWNYAERARRMGQARRLLDRPRLRLRDLQPANSWCVPAPWRSCDPASSRSCPSSSSRSLITGPTRQRAMLWCSRSSRTWSRSGCCIRG